MTSGMARGLVVSVLVFASGCDSTPRTPPDSPVIAADGVTVWPHRVEFRAVVCLDAGWSSGIFILVCVKS